MGLRAGSLNERLKILREVRVDSDFGGSETEYQFKCYIRAYHNAKDSNRTIINDEIVYTNTKTFEIRFYQPIDNEDIQNRMELYQELHKKQLPCLHKNVQ